MQKSFSLDVTVTAKSNYDKLLSAIKMYVRLKEVILMNEISDEALGTKLKELRLPIEEKCLKVLTYYVMYGFSKETNAECCKELKLSRQTNTQIISYLTKQGFLTKDIFNQTMRHINEELIALKQLITRQERSIISIEFVS